MISPVKYKTLDEHRTYLHEMVRLSLFFVHYWLETHPEETFSQTIRTRVDIYRKTEANPDQQNQPRYLFDEEPWLTMEREAHCLYEKYKDDRAGFERNAFEVFRASVDSRCERDFADCSILATHQCGSLRYNDGLWPDGKTMGFHIANAIAPRSFLSEPEHLKECFLHLMTIAEKVYGAVNIGTSTWLNSMPKWNAFFPHEWMNNRQEPVTRVNGYLSFWGQFVTARGTFHYRNAEHLRTTGSFPFYPRVSYCSIEAMRRKLGGENI